MGNGAPETPPQSIRAGLTAPLLRLFLFWRARGMAGAARLLASL
jgi:hypothetical protein